MSGVEASSLFYIQNRHSQGGGSLSISYIHNWRSQGGGAHPYHIFMIGVVRGGGGGGFIHIIYS